MTRTEDKAYTEQKLEELLACQGEDNAHPTKWFVDCFRTAVEEARAGRYGAANISIANALTEVGGVPLHPWPGSTDCPGDPAIETVSDLHRLLKELQQMPARGKPYS